MSDYQSLIEKLDHFIRKYYKNKLVKGVIYAFTSILLFFIIVALLEYFGNFNSSVRAFLFFSFIFSTLGIIGYYIVYPLIKLNKLGKIISYEDAANIIGNHFSNVKDKLLNTLQLANQKGAISQSHLSLVNASINQKASELRPVPFSTAIDISKNRAYLKYALIPVGILLLLFSINSSIITSSTERVVNYSTAYEPQAPFQFSIANGNLDVLENESIDVEVKLSGSAIPNEVFIEYDNQEYPLKKENNVSFLYTFDNVQKDKTFKLKAGGFESQEYTITTIPNPVIMGFRVELDYPNYTQRKDEQLDNIGDFTVPQGTKVKWIFNTKNTENVALKFSDTTVNINKVIQNQFLFEKNANNSEIYAVKTKNQFVKNKDSVSYYIKVIVDEYPKIEVNETVDSSNSKIKYFKGQIQDDYGFSKLTFNYKRVYTDSLNNTKSDFKTINIPFNGKFSKDHFFHYFDLSTLGLKLGERIEYYFQVWDNDGFNGAKSARTTTKTYAAPSAEELNKNLEQKNEEMKDEMEESIKDALKLKKDINDLKKDILNKKNLEWQDKKKVEDIIDQQKELTKQMEQLQEKNDNKNQEKNEFKQNNEQMQQKQEQMEKLMEELNSEEMKKLMEELEKMMEKLDKKQLQQKLDEIDMENIDLQKELERTLEMFKQMEMDEKLDELSKELEELAKEQEELAEDKEMSKEEKEQKQEKLNEKFEKVEDEMDKLDKMNEELENKRDMDELNKDEQDIKEDMKESLEQLQKNQKNKAKDAQKNASEKMKEMAQKMSDMMMGSGGEQSQEDMDALRALLENLIQLSFDQEELMDGFKKTSTNDPKYTELGQQQKKLKDDAKMIEDSLFALSKRVIQIESVVNKEINKINSHIDKSLYYISERQTHYITSNQQFAMTSINNLALLLDEALQQMQQQMSSQKQCNNNCNKPGGSKPKPSAIPSLKKMQEGVGQKLNELQKKMGRQKGENKSGQGGKDGELSKELAKLAAQQAEIRKRMEELGEKYNDGSGLGNEIKRIEKEMDKIEEDIVNKNINRETIKRQQDIMTRLLQAEKAEREREYDEKRESKTIKNQKYSNPKSFLEYKRKKEKELELLKTISPELVPYYKNKVNEYFDKVNQ